MKVTSLLDIEDLVKFAGERADNRDALEEVCRLAKGRAAEGSSVNTVAFSYFFEILTRKPFNVEINKEVAAKAARECYRLNDSQANITDHQTLLQFADRVIENVHDWESFEINYLESPNVDQDRIRRNLAMTPDERAARHARLLKQLRILHEARERYRSSANS